MVIRWYYYMRFKVSLELGFISDFNLKGHTTTTTTIILNIIKHNIHIILHNVNFSCSDGRTSVVPHHVIFKDINRIGIGKMRI